MKRITRGPIPMEEMKSNIEWDFKILEYLNQYSIDEIIFKTLDVDNIPVPDEENKFRVQVEQNKDVDAKMVKAFCLKRWKEFEPLCTLSDFLNSELKMLNGIPEEIFNEYFEKLSPIKKYLQEGSFAGADDKINYEEFAKDLKDLEYIEGVTPDVLKSIIENNELPPNAALVRWIGPKADAWRFKDHYLKTSKPGKFNKCFTFSDDKPLHGHDKPSVGPDEKFKTLIDKYLK
jgi:hypothetical protein